MTYTRRKIDLEFTLGEGSFGGGSQSSLKVVGLRVQAKLSMQQLPTPGGIAQIRVFGLTIDHINQLSKAGLYWLYRKNNKVILSAGDDQSGMATLFKGQIFEAYPDFGSQPEVSFMITANPGMDMQQTPSQPVSVKGSTNVTTVLEQIVKPFNLKVESNGVNVQLSNPYLQGSAWTQVIKAVKAANLFCYLDTASGVLAVWPKTGTRENSQVPVLSPENGMIGYPQFQQNLIIVRNLLDSSIRGPGQRVEVKSQLKAANGNWAISTIDYDLASETPGGPWEMVITLALPSLSRGGG